MLLSALQGRGIQLDTDDLKSVACYHLGDPRAHRAQPDNTDPLNSHAA